MKQKKSIASLLLAGLLLAAALMGCAARQTDEADGSIWDITDAEPEYLTQWPENAFTEKIVQPQSGEIDYVLDDTEAGRYAIFMKDISAEESDEYVQTLLEQGYSERYTAESGVSVGRMLEGEDAFLSVSYSEGVLGVLIIQKEPE